MWERLTSIGLVRDEAWLLAGDFNELMTKEEKVGGAERHESSFWDFRNMAENCKIRELRYTGNCLSWGGWRERVWGQCRLDRSFGNSEWFSLFPRSSMEYFELWASDHRPIRICFPLERDDRKRSHFFFDKRYLNKEGIEELIKDSWGPEGFDQSNTMERIGRCRKSIMKWKRYSDTNSRNKISRLKETLEKEVAKRYPSYSQMKRLKLDLFEALREEEVYWRQKCREEWLRPRDRNKKFFSQLCGWEETSNSYLDPPG